MRWRGAATIAGVAFATVCLGRADAQAPARRSGAAWQIVEWPSGAIVSSEGAERLRVAAQPGSFVKLPTLIAAFAAGLVTPDTRVPCKGEAVIAGHTIRCSHPRLRHPLRPAEALALSCNVWFATIGARLPRARLDGALAALGLPPSPPDAPMPLAATGLRATAVSPLMLVDALGRVLRDPSTVAMSERARSVVVDGLRGAALYGTASAFAGRGLDVAAKTGTADAPGGGVQGLVVAAWPAQAPTRALVLVAAGAAGADAAQMAADVATSRTTAARPSPVRAGTAAERPRAPDPSDDEAIVLRVGTPRGSSHDVRSYDLEDYVARVLAGEGAVGSAPAAMEALAVAVRTFALANRGRHARDGFDLCTLTHCQVLRAPNAAVSRAAAATQGQVLMADSGRPASVFFSASCGGRTERPSGVWPGAVDPPFLPSARDRACDGEPRWAAEIPVQDLERALRAAGFSGRALRDVDIDGRSGSGRVQRLRLEGLVPETISGQDFRMLVGRTLGWHLIKSTAFRLRRTGGGYRFDGQGFGHGVGLCVLGSTRRAADGDSARDILRAYYPGLAIQRIAVADVSAAAPSARRARRASRPPSSTSTPGEARPAAAPSPTIRLVLPSSAEGDRGALAALAREALDDLVRRTGRPAPARIDVVFHPSPDSFRRESGEPWWVAARTRATRIDLLPPTVLRDRGTLEQTLRHELAHVLTAPVLTDRAEWIKEGVAMHFAGEPPPASLLDEDGVPRRVRCPDDDDLRRSASPAAARQAYGRAVACVARALAEGKAWSELR
jgi:SpoIID/LytB domain protein